MESGTIDLFAPTDVRESALPWLPTVACGLAAALIAVVACPEPLARPPTPGEAALRALFTVCLVAGATAVVARVAFAAFFPSVGEQVGSAAWAYSGNAVWFAPLAIFVVQSQPWSIVGAALVGLATARLLRRWRAVFDEDAPAESPSQMFAGLPRAGSSGHLFYAFAGAVAIETGVIAQSMGRTTAAVMLAGAGCFIAACCAGPGEPAERAFPSRRPRVAFAIRAMCAVALATLGLIRIPGLAGAPGDSGQHGTASSSGSSIVDKDLLAGAILLANPSRHMKLVAPVVNRRATLSLKRPPPPASIEFSGEYWIFPISLRRPPKGSMVERTSPLVYKFTCVDRSPLLMQARQRLRFAIDPRCCSAIDVAVRNADPQPRTITLRTSLATSTLTRGRYQRLGDQGLPAAESAVLRFPIPARTAIPEFDEIVVEFDLGSPRMHRSANVSIERFAFIPRGR